jgi:hypothetical protein
MVPVTAITWAQSGDRRVWVAEAPLGELLTVTQAGRTAWHPAVIGTPGKTRLQAQRYAEGQVPTGSQPEGR